MGFFEDLVTRLRAGDSPLVAPVIAAGLKVHDVLTKESVPREVTCPLLYVGNLSFDASEDDLRAIFSKCGKVVSIEIARHKRTNRSKGFAFVSMATKAQAKRAVMKMHDLEFMERKLVVSGAKAGN